MPPCTTRPSAPPSRASDDGRRQRRRRHRRGGGGNCSDGVDGGGERPPHRRPPNGVPTAASPRRRQRARPRARARVRARARARAPAAPAPPPRRAARRASWSRGRRRCVRMLAEELRAEACAPLGAPLPPPPATSPAACAVAPPPSLFPLRLLPPHAQHLLRSGVELATLEQPLPRAHAVGELFERIAASHRPCGWSISGRSAPSPPASMAADGGRRPAHHVHVSGAVASTENRDESNSSLRRPLALLRGRHAGGAPAAPLLPPPPPPPFISLVAAGAGPPRRPPARRCGRLGPAARCCAAARRRCDAPPCGGPASAPGRRTATMSCSLTRICTPPSRRTSRATAQHVEADDPRCAPS